MASAAEVLPVVAAAGELLLRYGADVARVEDTVVRIARAYQIEEAEIFATPTGMFISLGGEDGVSAVRRVSHRTLALDRISALNSLSRELAARPIDPREALARVRAIEEQPAPYPARSEVLFSALAAAAASMLVGGALIDFLPAVLANLGVQLVQRIARQLWLPEALGDFLAGAAAVLCALGLHLTVGSAVGPVVAGGIMVLVPGIAFTASVRDAMAGDLLSAGARGLEALLKAAALASGVAATFYLTGGVPLG